MKYHQSAIAAAVAASAATFGNAQEQFSTGEFKHLNGSQVGSSGGRYLLTRWM